LDLPSSTRRVIAEFAARGIDLEILPSPTSTRTAAEAAEALGTSVAQIVKSLVFLVDGQGVLALVSGVNRLDEGKLARAVGGTRVTRANADQVRELTGFVIGGVPPISPNPDLRILCDEDLLQYPIVYAAAGTPHHNFGIPPRRLVEAAGATVADLKADRPAPRGTEG
jgi:prolyl-tRNA editing enzyme YbaK/EbsC (Cys-tRNA(Pro) deacylase)